MHVSLLRCPSSPAPAEGTQGQSCPGRPRRTHPPTQPPRTHAGKGGSKRPERDAIYDVDAMHEKLEDIGWADGAPWEETLAITHQDPAQVRAAAAACDTPPTPPRGCLGSTSCARQGMRAGFQGGCAVAVAPGAGASNLRSCRLRRPLLRSTATFRAGRCVWLILRAPCPTRTGARCR